MTPITPNNSETLRQITTKATDLLALAKLIAVNGMGR